MDRRYEGGCLCGGIRYVAGETPLNERVCHCRLCQKAVGAAFNARLLFRTDAVAVTGAVAWFSSSATLRRGFCPACGTTLFSARPAAGLIGITAGSLDDPSLFAPAMHIWTSSRQPWLVLEDGLPAYPQAAPAS